MSYTVAEDLTGLRAFVRARAEALGLPAHRGDLLALAVNELATNTLQHTDKSGTVRVWASRGQVVCDVFDSGPMRSFHTMPAPDSVRGRGLAIVAEIVDAVAATSTADGTLVRVRMDLLPDS
jgi:anti-sigma regulatory factor (Ser/Thr protein kinase)